MVAADSAACPSTSSKRSSRGSGWRPGVANVAVGAGRRLCSVGCLLLDTAEAKLQGQALLRELGRALTQPRAQHVDRHVTTQPQPPCHRPAHFAFFAFALLHLVEQAADLAKETIV